MFTILRACNFSLHRWYRAAYFIFLFSPQLSTGSFTFVLSACGHEPVAPDGCVEVSGVHPPHLTSPFPSADPDTASSSPHHKQRCHKHPRPCPLMDQQNSLVYSPRSRNTGLKDMWILNLTKYFRTPFPKVASVYTLLIRHEGPCTPLLQSLPLSAFCLLHHWPPSLSAWPLEAFWFALPVPRAVRNKDEVDAILLKDRSDSQGRSIVTRCSEFPEDNHPRIRDEVTVSGWPLPGNAPGCHSAVSRFKRIQSEKVNFCCCSLACFAKGITFVQKCNSWRHQCSNSLGVQP